MNILITGGAGYIGTSLVSKLAAIEEVKRIVVYDNLSRPNYNLFLGQRSSGSSKVQFVKGDLLDSRNLKKALHEIDIVYHLAAKVTTPFANDDAHLYEQVNHWGTAELVYAVEESNVKKFIYTSSLGIYGSSEIAIDETHAPNPKTFYAVSKLRGEEHVRRLFDRRQAYILRCGNVYGYNQSMRFDAVINKFVFEANFFQRITINGDGSQLRSFIHIDKLTDALANIIYPKLDAGTYNLVERSVSVIDVVDELKQLLPQLEFIFINQHLKLHQLNVKQNLLVNKALQIEDTKSLREELSEFITKFSF